MTIRRGIGFFCCPPREKGKTYVFFNESGYHFTERPVIGLRLRQDQTAAPFGHAGRGDRARPLCARSDLPADLEHFRRSSAVGAHHYSDARGPVLRFRGAEKKRTQRDPVVFRARLRGNRRVYRSRNAASGTELDRGSRFRLRDGGSFPRRGRAENAETRTGRLRHR